MSTDLEQRIAALAASWEQTTSAVTAEEILAAGSDDHGWPSTRVSELSPTPTELGTVALDRSRRRRARQLIAVGTAVAAVGAVVLLAGRHAPNPLEPFSPDSSDVATSPAGTLATAPATTAGPAPSDPAPTEAATSTVPAATEPAAGVPPDTVAMTPSDAEAALANLVTARDEALRGFTTIGFTVHRTQTFPNGSPVNDGGDASGDGAQVVLRNDGSAAVTSASFGTSYYDATTGTARAAFTGADGQPSYQQIDGLSDNSVPLGVPTGLANGVVTSVEELRSGLVAVTEEVLDGRAVWRVDQEFDAPPGAGATIWIDQATGITVQTRTAGMQSMNDVPVTEVITLSDLVPGASMPADFPSAFPVGAEVAVSGDPQGFSAVTLEAAAAEMGTGIVLPTLPPDQIALVRMNFGNPDGTTTISPSLIVRWFDGFARTELTITKYPPTMALADTCTRCDLSLLEEIQSWTSDEPTLDVRRDSIAVSIRGGAATMRAVIVSLVDAP